jgi:O-succinylbenzoate synthase
VKPSLFGGADGALGQLAAVKARVVFSSALETAVGARSALRTAFAWPGPQLALGFGVWPLFADPRFDGPAAAPFVRRTDVEQIDPEVVWNALG